MYPPVGGPPLAWDRSEMVRPIALSPWITCPFESRGGVTLTRASGVNPARGRFPALPPDNRPPTPLGLCEGEAGMYPVRGKLPTLPPDERPPPCEGEEGAYPERGKLPTLPPDERPPPGEARIAEGDGGGRPPPAEMRASCGIRR